jgi:N-acyl-L-homoserine lactone synthetase
MEQSKQTYGADSLVAIEQHGAQYEVRALNDGDSKRRAEYQRLRGVTFVQRLGWQVAIDSEGRETDRYDSIEANDFVSAHCVYGINHREHLLGGVRILTLRSWSDSMVENEFHTIGMLPMHALHLLKSQYRCIDVLELTRLCVQPFPTPPFRQMVARDLTYATVYALAQATGRTYALALVDSLYFQVMRRAHFLLREIYSQRLDQRRGYALVVIDLWGTIRALRACGEDARVGRMLALCA